LVVENQKRLKVSEAQTNGKKKQKTKIWGNKGRKQLFEVY